MNMHMSYTLIHTHIDTDAQALTQLYIHQNTFVATHKSISQHPRIIPARINSCTHTRAHTYIHTHTHTHLHSRTSTYTHVWVSSNTYMCIQNKNAFTDTTLIHTDTLKR